MSLRHLSIAMILSMVIGTLSPHSPSAIGVAAFSSSRYQLPGGIVVHSSPTLADVDGDGFPEVLIGTTACGGDPCSYNRPTLLVVMKGNGTILWSKDVGAPINSAPAVGDLDGDGDMEVVVSLGGDVKDTNHHGGVVAYDHNGNQLWRFYTQDHNHDGWRDGVFSSPTLCDVEGDGNLEIAFGGWDQRIYLLDRYGNPIWNNLPAGFSGPGYYNADSIWSTAACADLNRDGTLEIIIGADITGGGILPDGTTTQDGGFLYIFDKDGRVLVRRYLPETIYAAPAVGDLDGDGDLEIVSGTGWYWWNAHGRTEQPYVYVFDTGRVFDSSRHYSDPEKLPFFPGWPQPTDYPGFSSPALADLDGDGDLEIVIGTGHPDLPNDDIQGAGSIYVWHHTGASFTGWPVHPKNAQNYDAPIFSSPTVADVDGDGRPEILFTMLWDVQIYSANGALKNRLGTYWTVWGSPAVGDTDGDGYPEVWIGGSYYFDSSYGYLWRFESDVQGTRAEAPWPMFHRDLQHTGYHPMPPQMTVSPPSLYVLHPYGGTETEQAVLSIRNVGDGSFIWGVSEKPANTLINPPNGTAFYTSTVHATVMVTTTGYTTGTYSLGNIVITGTVNSSPVAGSPATIPVTLYVGQVHRVYLPLILRGAR